MKLQSTQAYEMFDPMKWWRGNEEEYPTLVAIAYDIFAVPCMSVEPERVFSGYLSIC